MFTWRMTLNPLFSNTYFTASPVVITLVSEVNKRRK